MRVAAPISTWCSSLADRRGRSYFKMILSHDSQSMVKKQPPLYQKMLSFTYCKQPLLYHRKFSLTQLSGCSYIIGSSPLTQCRQPLLCKRVLSPRYECSCIYIKGHSLYLLWAATPILILNNEGSRPFTSAHFQKAAASDFIIQKGVMAKRFLLSQRNMWLEGLSRRPSLHCPPQRNEAPLVSHSQQISPPW